jgi:hypothetical protein
MSFFKPYSTLAVGVILGMFAVPKIRAMIGK